MGRFVLFLKLHINTNIERFTSVEVLCNDRVCFIYYAYILVKHICFFHAYTVQDYANFERFLINLLSYN